MVSGGARDFRVFPAQPAFQDLLEQLHAHLAVLSGELMKVAAQYDCDIAATSQVLRQENLDLTHEINLLRTGESSTTSRRFSALSMQSEIYGRQMSPAPSENCRVRSSQMTATGSMRSNHCRRDSGEALEEPGLRKGPGAAGVQTCNTFLEKFAKRHSCTSKSTATHRTGRSVGAAHGITTTVADGLHCMRSSVWQGGAVSNGTAAQTSPTPSAPSVPLVAAREGFSLPPPPKQPERLDSVSEGTALSMPSELPPAPVRTLTAGLELQAANTRRPPENSFLALVDNTSRGLDSTCSTLALTSPNAGPNITSPLSITSTSCSSGIAMRKPVGIAPHAGTIVEDSSASLGVLASQQFGSVELAKHWRGADPVSTNGIRAGESSFNPDRSMAVKPQISYNAGSSRKESLELGKAALWPIWARKSSHSELENAGQQPLATLKRQETGCMRIAAISVRLMEMATGPVAVDGAIGSAMQKLDTYVNTRCVDRCIKRAMVHPRNKKVLAWQMFGGLLITYDVLMLPLQAFEMPEGPYWSATAWTSTIAWTLDLVLHFFLGYETLHTVEMLPTKIWRNYLTHWFIVDASLVSFDWFSIFLVGHQASSKATKSVKVLRSLRSLRILRLVRVFKFMKLVQRIMDRIQSEVIMVLGKIVGLMLFTIVVSHYMGCYWYFIGTSGELFGVSDTWISNLPKAYDRESDVQELYFLSFHWSLAHSGYVPTDIRATNMIERGFSSASSLFWLLFEGLIISAFSLWLLQLRDSMFKRNMEGTRLRRYLVNHRIGTELTEDVLKYFRINSGKHSRHVHEEEIAIFKDLPVHLRVMLHRQVYMPILKQHPIFDAYAAVNEAGLLSVCHIAMVEHYFAAGTEVFGEGQDAEFMFYALSGKFEYYCPLTKEFEEVEPFTWVNEAVLWRTWKQRGVLTAFSSSETVGLDAAKFHAIMEEVEDSGFSIDLLRRYGKLVTQYFAVNDPYTDFWGDYECLKELVDEAVSSDIE